MRWCHKWRVGSPELQDRHREYTEQQRAVLNKPLSVKPWNWAWGGCRALPPGCSSWILPNKAWANPGNVDFVSAPSPVSGWDKIRTQQATKPGIAQGSNLFLVSFSPFPSQLHQGWIWIWRSQMSCQDPHEHKAVSSGRKSSWEVPEPQTVVPVQ